MKAPVTVQHPAHVHFFRNAVADLLWVPLAYERRVLRAARREAPDVVAAIAEPAAAHAGLVTGASSVIFDDTEHAAAQNLLAHPFADRVCTPECYADDLGKKQVRYPGYQELAYLHPDRFSPSPDVFDGLDLRREEPYVVLRLGSWTAAHDIGRVGLAEPVAFVEALEATGARVVISAEGDLPPALAERRIEVPVDRLHDLLYYADLCVGEGATTVTESAVLGTPAIFVSEFELGNLRELEYEYGLAFSYSGPDRRRRALARAREILNGSRAGTDGGDDRWQRRRDRLLAEKTDTTDIVVEQLLDAARESPRPASRRALWSRAVARRVLDVVIT